METPLILQHATLIDPRDGAQLADATVTVCDGLVTDVAPGAPVPDPGARVVDLAGAYLVPGFNDMHAHPFNRPDGAGGSLALMLAHGITGVRQMSGSHTVLKRRADGSLRLPDDAPAILEIPGAVLTPGNAGSPEQARATVRGQADEGADFIKVALTTPEIFTAAQDEAHRVGLPILGHLPPGIDPVEAARGGLRSVEHLGPALGLLACCSTERRRILPASRGRSLPTPPVHDIPALQGLLDRAMERLLAGLVVNPATFSRPRDIQLTADAIATFDDRLADELATALRSYGVWQVPTMIRSLSQFRCDDPRFASDPDHRYMEAATLRRWRKSRRKFLRFTPEQRDVFSASYERLRELLRSMDRAGTRMLAGSDCCGGGWLVPGASLHHEFDELASAGLDPLTVLQMTTSNVAEYLGTDAAPGVVERGRPADLTVLGGDPRRGVAELHRVVGVVRAGRWYDQAALDALKERVAAERSAF